MVDEHEAEVILVSKPLYAAHKSDVLFIGVQSFVSGVFRLRPGIKNYHSGIVRLYPLFEDFYPFRVQSGNIRCGQQVSGNRPVIVP